MLAQPGRAGVKWAVPCPNTPRVANAPREFAAGLKGRRSTMAIADAHGKEAPHAMAIEGRMRPEGDGPEERHVALAANSTGIGAGAPCPRRRGIEIGHGMARHARIRTPVRDGGAGIACFVPSPMGHGAWAVLRSGALAGGGSRRIPQGALETPLVLGARGVLGIRPEPEPSPPVAPQAYFWNV